MRATIPQPQFLKGLQVVERAVNDRSAMPILSMVLVEAKGQGLRVAATDLDVGIQYHLPLTESVEEGAVALPARRLSTLIRELPDEPITLESKKNHTATLVCGTSQFRLPGLPVEDFPIFPSFEPGARIELPEASLRDLIARTAFAMSMEETRFVLNGAQLSLQGTTATLVATDGRRLALARTTLSQPTAAPLQVILPSKTVRELGRLLQHETTEPVSIIPLKDNQLAFQFSDVAITTRLVEGQFPAYEAVIPAPVPTTLTCSRQLLANAVRRASLMTTASSQAVLFELAEQRLTISKETAEFGSAREELPARYRGTAMTVAFNPEFWLDVLKVLEGEELTVEIASPEKPAVVRLPEFLYVVLPMKLA
jgi:DNA polymerase-3 subunit beta